MSYQNKIEVVKMSSSSKNLEAKIFETKFVRKTYRGETKLREKVRSERAKNFSFPSENVSKGQCHEIFDKLCLTLKKCFFNKFIFEKLTISLKCFERRKTR